MSNRREAFGRFITINHKSVFIGGLADDDVPEKDLDIPGFKPVKANEVIGELRKEVPSWLRTLTLMQTFSIKKYAKNSQEEEGEHPKFYQRLNEAIREEAINHTKMPDNYKRHQVNISAGLRKFKLRKDIICYRRIKKDVYEGVREGDVVNNQGFMSTSAIEQAANRGKYLVVIFARRNSPCAYIASLSNKYSDQEEVLFDLHNQYRVLYRKGTTTFLEVLK